jgi:hypothetical protein
LLLAAVPVAAVPAAMWGAKGWEWGKEVEEVRRKE